MDAINSWTKKKKEISEALDKAIEREVVDTDVLKTMKKFLENTRLKKHEGRTNGNGGEVQ